MNPIMNILGILLGGFVLIEIGRRILYFIQDEIDMAKTRKSLKKWMK